jgi:hypothetical protein
LSSFAEGGGPAFVLALAFAFVFAFPLALAFVFAFRVPFTVITEYRQTPMPQPTTPSWSASLLRRDLNARANHLATTQNLLHEISPGSDPTIIFGRDEQGCHGNFHPASYINICANPAWLRRLTKPHTASRRSRARKDWQWMELDSANSSDALLMNIFCHPGVFNGHTLTPAVANLLNVETKSQPCFGINPGVPLRNKRKSRTKLPPDLTNRTEIDLHLGNLFVEAKLTESSFQTAAPRLIERYRDLETVFNITRLPKKILHTPATHPPVEDFSRLEEPCASQPTSSPAHKPTRTVIEGYQLIRNVLAAYAAEASFCVLCDARRHDLIETWYSILSAVHSLTFATHLKLLTWQELTTALPKDLQLFLEAKYGILPGWN